MRPAVAPIAARRQRGAKRWVHAVVSLLLALGVFLLAYRSPNDCTGWDAALALVGSQALLEHGTLNLDVYRGDPRLAYDLATDYRSLPWRGGHYHPYVGVPVASIPAVWVARLCGRNMLEVRTEAKLQNALSALVTAIVFLLLAGLSRCYVDPATSLVIASVSTFGTMVTSTMGTALWDIDYLVVLVCGFLIWLARRGDRPIGPRAAALGLGLLAVGFVLRPSAGLLGFAFMVLLLGAGTPRVRRVAVLALAAGATFAIWAQFIGQRYIPGRYLPLAPFLGNGHPGVALPGYLVSPSRGLFVFCPFLLVTLAVVGIKWRAAIRSAAPRLVLVWIAALLLAVAVKPAWWGGGGFGPRLLTELVPGWTLLTAWGWSQLQTFAPSVRRVVAASYLGLGSFAIFVHSYQGLFNVATQRWVADAEEHPEFFSDWRWPQFLATEDTLQARVRATQEALDIRQVAGKWRVREFCRPGDEARFDGRRLVFRQGWYRADPGWGRWSRGSESELAFDLRGLDPQASYLLDFQAAALGPQKVSLSLQGAPLGVLTLPGLTPHHALVVIPRGRLREGENRLRLSIPGARSIAGDARPLLGVALVSLRFVELASDPRLTFGDDAFFRSGFGVAEAAGRWTDGPRAQLALPLGSLLPGPCVMEIDTGGALERQDVEVLVNGQRAGRASVAGQAPQTLRFPVPPTALQPNSLNDVTLLLPDARPAAGDAGSRGLLFRTLRLTPAAPGDGPR